MIVVFIAASMAESAMMHKSSQTSVDRLVIKFPDLP